MDRIDHQTVVNINVVRGVDNRGRITDNPAEVVEGELRLTRSDGTWEIVSVVPRSGCAPVIVSA